MLQSGLSTRQQRRQAKFDLQEKMNTLERVLSPYLAERKFSANHDLYAENISCIRLSIRQTLQALITGILFETLKCSIRMEKNLFQVNTGYVLITLKAAYFTTRNLEKLSLQLSNVDIIENNIHIIAFS